MNDRIRELKKQATKGRVDSELFAELLVQDCAEWIYEHLKYTAPKLAADLSIRLMQRYGIEYGN